MAKVKFQSAQVWVARESDGYSATSKPAADSANWIPLGSIASFEVSPVIREHEVWKAMPGKLRRTDILETGGSVDMTCTCNEVSVIAYQSLFLSGPPDTGTPPTYGQFNPAAGTTLRAWAKVQLYDEENDAADDDPRLTFDVWCHVKANASQIARGEAVTVDLVFRELYSALNTGTFTTLS